MLNFKNFQEDGPSVWEAQFFNPRATGEWSALQSLLRSNNHIQVYDQIVSQKRELYKIRNPSIRFDEAEFNLWLQSLQNEFTLEQLGTWVYFPWNNKLVHLLDEDEFVEVRTSRNTYKITPEEKVLLRQKKIGVIGLSVGQMIAMTISMERICGELRMADFDDLELSNMNRIRSSVANISIPKVIIAAREIAELDPYLKLRIFKEGITEENIDQFLNDGGKLDVLVEECDGLDVKILSRIKCREMKIPVIMETNDRGMIDIERYDLEDGMPLLHGLIPEDMGDLKHLKNLTNQEKVPLLGAMVGIDKISERMKLSLSEMGKTISTWPQLASSVVLGGAMVTDVARRILLNQLRVSGRFYVDFEQLIS